MDEKTLRETLRNEEIYRDWLRKFFVHWDARIGSVLGIGVLGMYGAWGGMIAAWILGAVALGCFFSASFRMWREQIVLNGKLLQEFDDYKKEVQQRERTFRETVLRQTIKKIASKRSYSFTLGALLRSGADKIKNPGDFWWVCAELEKIGHPLPFERFTASEISLIKEDVLGYLRFANLHNPPISNEGNTYVSEWNTYRNRKDENE